MTEEQQLPEVVDFDESAKNRIIEAIKIILRRMAEAGLWRSSIVYEELLDNPALIEFFIVRLGKNLEIASDFMVDAAGNPVLDRDTKLTCGYTLSEIERGLVVTCAKHSWSMVTRQDLKTAEGLRETIIPKEIRPYLCFRWQLPLLQAYASSMDSEHAAMLGSRLLWLRSADAVEAVGKTPVEAIDRLQKTAGDKFEELLRSTPTVVRGLHMCSDSQFHLLHRLAGDDVWRLLAGEPKVVGELLRTSEDRLEIMALVIADISWSNLNALRDIRTTTLAPLLETFYAAFGKYAPKLMAKDEFTRAFLADIVRTFGSRNTSVEAQRAELASDAKMKWSALRPKIAQWYKTLK